MHDCSDISHVQVCVCVCLCVCMCVVHAYALVVGLLIVVLWVGWCLVSLVGALFLWLVG